MLMSNELIINKNYLLNFVQPSTADLIMLLVKKDQIELAHFERQINIEKAVDGTTLKKLSKTLDSKDLTKMLVFLITRFSENFNVGKKFTEEQAIVMAIDLIDSFGHETIEDIVLMFKMARTGRIGDGKDFKLDSQTVFHKWIPNYLDLKAEFMEKKHHNQNALLNKDQLTIEQVRNSYKKKLNAQQIEDKRNKRIDEITQGFNREMLENLILEWQQDEKKKQFVSYLTKKRLTIRT
jgi:hypothetical protein